MVKTSSQTHKALAKEEGAISIALVTVSDSRRKENDANAQFLINAVKKSGHKIAGYEIVKDEVAAVEDALTDMVATNAQIIIFNGGTGIAKRDRTFDVISKKFEKTLSGFGEIFRMLSYEQVGSAAMLSRATAGIYKGKVVILTPGSPQAVELAWKKLIEPELQHLAWELTR